MNFKEEIEKLKEIGYSEDNARARLCQDIILKAISMSNMIENTTIKGGVVMRNLSKSERRATQDIDLDFIRYSISDESIKSFIAKLSRLIKLEIIVHEPIKNLNQHDYKGKRVIIDIKDHYNNSIRSKMDIGVHKDLDIIQEEYCFDICFQKNTVSLLMNSKEQIITEKLKSLLRFMTRNTRYKDIFDIYFLKQNIDKKQLNICINKYIFEDSTLNVNNYGDIVKRLEKIFNDEEYKKELLRSNKNWLNMEIEEILNDNILFFKSL